MDNKNVKIPVTTNCLVVFKVLFQGYFPLIKARFPQPSLLPPSCPYPWQSSFHNGYVRRLCWALQKMKTDNLYNSMCIFDFSNPRNDNDDHLAMVLRSLLSLYFIVAKAFIFLKSPCHSDEHNIVLTNAHKWAIYITHS